MIRKYNMWILIKYYSNDVIIQSKKKGQKMESAQNLHQNTASPLVDITFTNITYQVKVSSKDKARVNTQTKTILHGASGIFKGGQMTAIMGSSGAGKTTLLNVISGRIGQFKGELHANGQPYSCQNFGNFGNYVMQKDVLMQTLTVRQTLMFAAQLRHVSLSRIQERIQYLTKQFKLQKCLDVLVGGPNLKGISGGQKKRTSIVFQLMSDPQVIALDEPTSGMDSLTSYIIVNQLKNLVKQGKTVFLTIHQPNSEIFDLFDKLILMVEGRIIYQGKTDNSLQYFEQNFGLVSPPFTNPADFLINIIHGQKRENTQRFQSYYQAYDKVLKDAVGRQIKDGHKEIVAQRSIETSNMNTLKQLLKRDYRNNIRNPTLLASRLVQIVCLTIYIGGLYFNVGKKDYTDPINWASISGFCFFISMDMLLQALLPVALVFPSERSVFLKEENSKMYGILPYFISRNIVNIPFSLILPAIYCSILYFMVALSLTVQQFFTLYFILVIMCFVGSSMGLLAGSILQDQKGVTEIVPIFILPMVIISGYFKNPDNMPKWFSWLQYISPFKFGLMAITENEVMHKESLVEHMNFDMQLWQSVGVLFGLGVLFTGLSLFLLWVRKSRLQ